MSCSIRAPRNDGGDDDDDDQDNLIVEDDTSSMRTEHLMMSGLSQTSFKTASMFIK